MYTETTSEHHLADTNHRSRSHRERDLNQGILRDSEEDARTLNTSILDHLWLNQSDIASLTHPSRSQGHNNKGQKENSESGDDAAVVMSRLEDQGSMNQLNVAELLHEKDMLAQMLRTSQSQNKALEKNLIQTQQELTGLRRLMEAENEARFRQLPAAQMSDAQIGDQYHRLCVSIEDWIDTELPNLEDAYRTILGELLEKDPNHPLTQGFLALQERSSVRTNRKLEYSVVRYFVQLLLDFFVFTEQGHYFVGLEIEDGSLLKRIERQMRSLQPYLEEDTIDVWRSNTLRAISADPQYRQGLQKDLHNLSKSVCNMLEPLFPQHMGMDRAFFKFHDRVTLRAAELAGNMRKFPQCYQFLRTERRREFSKRDMKSYTFIDSKSDKALTLSRFRHFQDSDIIGVQVFEIHPALVRWDPKIKKCITIRYPVVAIQVFEP